MKSGSLIMNGEQLKTIVRTVLLSLCILLTVHSRAQQVSTIISKDKIVLGEQLELQIKIEGITASAIQQDFLFPDTVNHLEILSDTSEQAGNSTLIYTLTITSFDSGYWQLPPFELVLNNQHKIVTQPVGITVLPVDVSNLEDYHDIKDILEIKPQNNWWVIASVAAMALMALFGLLWFINRKTLPPHKVITAVPNLDMLYQKTIQQIAGAASGSDLSNQLVVAIVFNNITQLARAFSEAAYRQKTAHLTTGEYIVQMKGRMPVAETENKYFQLLRLSDAVKFAKFHPHPQEIHNAIDIAQNAINDMYQQNKLNG